MPTLLSKWLRRVWRIHNSIFVGHILTLKMHSKYCLISFHMVPRTVKFMESESTLVDTRAWGIGDGDV